MDSFCAKLLKSVLLLPFMAGNYRRRQNGSRYYDCTISSRVLFLVVISIIIVFTASQEIQASADVRLGIVMVLLAALIACGTLGCFIVGYLAHKHGLQYVVVRQNANKSKLQVIFLWIFGLASGFRCSFLIDKEIDCSISNTREFYWNSILFYTTMLPVGLCTETIFITYFSTYKLRNSSIVHYSMLMLLAANMSVLFHIIISKDSIFSTYFEVNHELNITSCLDNNSTVSDFLQISNIILSPTSTEFCLLSTTIILEIWSPAKVHHLHNDIPYTEISDIQDSESTHLLQDVTEIVPEHSENRGRRNLWQIFTLTVSFAIGIGHLISIAAKGVCENNVRLQNFTEIYELIWKILLIIVNLVGFVCLEYYCSPEDSPKPFKTREYVYLLSACCMIMLHICEAIAGSISSDVFSGCLLCTSILSIFQDYLQVVFLLHANRCRKSCARSQITLLDSVLIFIFVGNFIFWISDRFILEEFQSTRVLKQEQFSKGVLSLAYSVLLPVSVFFRFTSFLEYFATFKQYRSLKMQ